MTQRFKTRESSQRYTDPWSSGYDISLTRRKSPVRVRVGPLLTLFFLLFLTACSPNPTSTNVDLADNTIQSGENTTLSVTVHNQADQPIQTTVLVTSDGEENVDITYPEQDLLTTTLYPDERITRILRIKAQTQTKRTDYEVTVDIVNESEIVETRRTTLTVTK